MHIHTHICIFILFHNLKNNSLLIKLSPNILKSQIAAPVAPPSSRVVDTAWLTVQCLLLRPDHGRK